jgi:hypothetical protein
MRFLSGTTKHIHLLRRLVLIISLLTIFDTVYATNSGQIDLRSVNLEEHAPISLDGEWAFYWKNFLHFNKFSNINPTTLSISPKFGIKSLNSKRLPKHTAMQRII